MLMMMSSVRKLYVTVQLAMNSLAVLLFSSTICTNYEHTTY